MSFNRNTPLLPPIFLYAVCCRINQIMWLKLKSTLTITRKVMSGNGWHPSLSRGLTISTLTQEHLNQHERQNYLISWNILDKTEYAKDRHTASAKRNSEIINRELMFYWLHDILLIVWTAHVPLKDTASISPFHCPSHYLLIVDLEDLKYFELPWCFKGTVQINLSELAMPCLCGANPLNN